jgi:predicted secreted hydrolase
MGNVLAGKSSSAESDAASDMNNGFKAVVRGQPLVFPNDHMAHKAFRQEWWYLTANLKTEDGQELGLQWTQFRFALSAATGDTVESSETAGAEIAGQAAQDNSWTSNQIYMAHSAVTTEQVHLASEKWSRSHPELAGVDPDPLTIKLDNWRWQSQNASLFPALLSVESDEFSYQLSLDSSSPFQRQGDQGYSKKSADGRVASYYYSQPLFRCRARLN